MINTTIFVASDEERWSCATKGCAAGFIFLEEAETGSVFDSIYERVFTAEEWEEVQRKVSERIPFSDDVEIYLSYGKPIKLWAADKLGITYDEAYDLFYNFGSTEGIISHLERLKKSYEAEE